MHRVFTIFVCGVLFLLSCVIFSLLPIDKLGDIVKHNAKQHNIEITSNLTWNFRLLGFQASTSNIVFNTNIGNVFINGYGEDCLYSFISGGLSFSKLVLNVYADNIDDAYNTVEKEIMSNSFYGKNITVNFFFKNDKSKIISNEHKTFNEEDYTLKSEVVLMNTYLTKERKKISFKADIPIEKEKKMSVMFSVSNRDGRQKETNIKINNNNIVCYIHHFRKKGEVSCNVYDLYGLVKDFGFTVEDEYIKNIIDKRIKLNGKITTSDMNGLNLFSGNISVNENVGNVEYNGLRRMLQISFDEVDLDVRNLKQEYINKQYDKNEERFLMTGLAGNKFIKDNNQRKNIVNINSLRKILNIALQRYKPTDLNVVANIGNLILNNIKAEDVDIHISQNKGSNDFIISGITGKIGDSFLQIKYMQGQKGNIAVAGRDLNTFSSFFNLDFLKKDIVKSDFSMNGDIVLSTNGLKIDDLSLFINDKKVIRYNLTKQIDYFTHKLKTEKSIIIDGIDIDNYFDMKYFYSKYYDKFAVFQRIKEQDTVIWRMLFDKHNNDSILRDTSYSFIVKNSSFKNIAVGNFVFDYLDKNGSLSANIVANSDVFTGTVKLRTKNVNGNENIKIDAKIKDIDLSQIKSHVKDFESVNNTTIHGMLFSNKDYNIPSFLGVNGLINVDIDNFMSYNEGFYDDIKGTIRLSNGIFTTDNLTYNIGEGTVKSIINLSLQGQPEINAGITLSKVSLKDIFDTRMDGLIYSQCLVHSTSFNPVDLIKKANGKCNLLLQNLQIPNFDLLNASSHTISNGVVKDIKFYKNMIAKKTLQFPKAEGNMTINEGLFSGVLRFQRELVSGNYQFNYNIIGKTIEKSSGIFAMMLSRIKQEKPFAIYIPVGCYGKLKKPECVVNWESLENAIKSVK